MNMCYTVVPDCFVSTIPLNITIVGYNRLELYLLIPIIDPLNPHDTLW